MIRVRLTEFLGREPTLYETVDAPSRIDITAIAVSLVVEPEAGIPRGEGTALVWRGREIPQVASYDRMLLS
jgi:hypothetical protein